MNTVFKFAICILLILSISNTGESYNINYGKYIKNYYNIPSYDNLEYSFKNEFYENVHKQHLKMLNDNTNENLPIKFYKTKLDNIILYF